MGRPTKCTEEMTARICEIIAEKSPTINEICEEVGIAPSSYKLWKAKNSTFSDAVKKAEEEFIKNNLYVAAKNSLLKKVEGYHEAETTTTVDGSGNVRDKKTVDKYYAPDTAAVIFTLCNADPEHWKNRQTNEVTGANGKGLFDKLTDEELDAKINELKNQSK